MLEDFGTITSILIKYWIYLIYIVVAVGLIHSFITKLRNEPKTLAKALFFAALPPALGFAFGYWFMHKIYEAPGWACAASGLGVFLLSSTLLEKYVEIKFKGEP